jgi:putative membrane protein
VSETRITPRFELEQRAIQRLEPEPLPVVLEPSAGVGTLTLALGGAAVLLVGLAGLGTANFVADQFLRAAPLGWATLAVAAVGFGMIGAGIWRELRGLFGLRRVDDLRARLVDPARQRAAALEWLASLPEGAGLIDSVTAINDPDAVLSLLRAGPAAALRGRAETLGRVAALQMVAATAAIPSPALDGLVVAWRGTRLVRQVAALHGLRPGLLGTMSLLRRVMTSAASVAAMDFAADTAARALLSNPLLQHLAGDMAASGIAARRMIVLARATDAACSPLT